MKILRKALGHKGYVESTRGWSLAIVVNLGWVSLFQGFGPPIRNLEVFGLTMAVTCLLVALLGFKVQRDYDTSVAG